MKSSTDGLEVVQKMSWSDLRKNGFLVLQLKDPRFVDRVKDQRACLKLRLRLDVVIVHSRLPCDLYPPNNSRPVAVFDGRGIYGRSFGAMKSEVPLVSRLVFARQPYEADEIVVSILFIVGSKEEDGGDDGSDLDQVGVGWLAVFDLKVFSCRFEERGKFFRRHGVRVGLSALL